eukprot:5966452-Alexandrium_andersonii.AAC.1
MLLLTAAGHAEGEILGRARRTAGVKRKRRRSIDNTSVEQQHRQHRQYRRGQPGQPPGSNVSSNVGKT